MGDLGGNLRVALISHICLGVFGLVSVVVAVRLLLLASRTRQLPEFLIGLAFLTGGVLGRGAFVAAMSAPSLPESLRLGLFMGGRFMLVICALSIALTAWRVFQRDQAWARGLFAALVAVLAVHCALDAFVTHPAEFQYESFGAWIGTVAKSGAFAWGSWESLRYYAMLRRRIPLGLADPVVANRIALWGVASGLMACLFPVNLVVVLLTGIAQETVASSVFQSVAGLTVAVLIALAFFPPVSYLRRIAGRAARYGN